MKKSFLNLGLIASTLLAIVAGYQVRRTFSPEVSSNVRRTFSPEVRRTLAGAGSSLHSQAQKSEAKGAATTNAGSGGLLTRAAGGAGSVKPLSQRSQRLTRYLNSRSKKNWKIEQVGSAQINIFGGELSEKLSSDKKALDFVRGVMSAADLGDGNIEIEKTSKKTTNFEVIDEFVHKIEGIEVYNSYARLFRDEGNLDATDLVLEIKQIEEYISLVAYDESEVQAKMADLYTKLNYQVLNIDCSNRNFFVDSEKKAQLSYVCRMATGGNTPQNFEVVVSAQTAKVLYQKTVTIYN